MKKLLALILALMLIAPAAMADVTFPLEETATLSIALQQTPLVNDYEDNALTKWLFERTNVQLEFVLFLPVHRREDQAQPDDLRRRHQGRAGNDRPRQRRYAGQHLCAHPAVLPRGAGPEV